MMIKLKRNRDEPTLRQGSHQFVDVLWMQQALTNQGVITGDALLGQLLALSGHPHPHKLWLHSLPFGAWAGAIEMFALRGRLKEGPLSLCLWTPEV